MRLYRWNRACTHRRSNPSSRTVTAAALILLCLCCAQSADLAQSIGTSSSQTGAATDDVNNQVRDCTVTVHYNRGKPVNSFEPVHAFGAGIDGLSHGEVDKVYTAANLKAMLSAGFKPLTYRLRTELGIEAWHWNPKGVWSDPLHKLGYWTSNSTSASPILTCYGYRLPRRGDTIDQANNTGYSRILDDDPNTFWKSNPYLDHHFTGDDDSLHPQWIVLDIGKRRSVDAIRILWARPYSVRFRVEYCISDNPNTIFDSSPTKSSLWQRFAHGMVSNGAGGSELLRLSDMPVSARIIRIILLRSSGIAPVGSKDIRDRLGFAVREINLGLRQVGRAGQIRDWLKHGRTASTQSMVYVSSTDPWHRACDIDLATEQPGFDRVLESGLANGMPILTPIAPLYDTPENAAQMIRYLRARQYPLRQIEVGEEPDGQNIMPEDYAALYLQWANAALRVDPTLRIGGPGLQTSVQGYETWADASGNSSWLNRFVNYLRRHKRLHEFNFFSFEWYPFDDIHAPAHPEQASSLLRRVVHQFDSDGVPRSIPWIITEYGYSSFACRQEAEMPGAMVNVETAAEFLALGGAASYYYGYEPSTLASEESESSGPAKSWGNLMLFLADDSGTIKAPMAAYFAAQMVTQDWLPAGLAVHQMFAADTDMRNSRGEELVSAYPVLLPDGRWSLLILNKDPTHAVRPFVQVVDGSGSAPDSITGQIDVLQYGHQQYVWHADGPNGYAFPNDPPVRLTFKAPHSMILPPYSITILKCSDPRLKP